MIWQREGGCVGRTLQPGPRPQATARLQPRARHEAVRRLRPALGDGHEGCMPAGQALPCQLRNTGKLCFGELEIKGRDKMQQVDGEES